MLLQVHPHLLFLLLLLLLLVLLLALLLVQPPQPHLLLLLVQAQLLLLLLLLLLLQPHLLDVLQTGWHSAGQAAARPPSVSIPPPFACPSALRPPESGATQEQQVATPLPPDLSAEHVLGFRILIH